MSQEEKWYENQKKVHTYKLDIGWEEDTHKIALWNLSANILRKKGQ